MKYFTLLRHINAAKLTHGCPQTPAAACPRFGSPQPRVAMDGQPALSRIGLAVLACNSALAIWNSWGDAGSVAFVFVADAALLLLFLCLRRVERAGGSGRSARAAGVGADDAAHGHVRVQGRAAHAAGRRRRCLGDGGGHRGGRLLGLLPQLIVRKSCRGLAERGGLILPVVSSAGRQVASVSFFFFSCV